jgi:outer membrane protein assembly factor BamB
VIGGVVIASDQGATLVGLDAATGKTLWSLPQGTTALTPIAVPWSHGGKDYALSVGSTGNDREAQGVLRLIDPAAGKALWELPIHAPGKGVTVHQDIALMFSGASSGEGDEDDKKGKSDTKPGMTQSQSALNCVAVRLSIDKPSKLWSIPCPWSNGNLAPAASPRGHVCLAGREEARLLDLQTGKELAACKAPGPANEGQVEQVEDRFLMTHDGSHGRQTLTMLPDSADAFAAMGQPVYAFLHMQTTSYHNVPMTRCYVDGRIFIRGMEAIYCYDLRQ